MNETLAGAITVIASYLFGGIPIGLLVGRARGIEDIRKYGSGNIGASNVLRVIGVKAGVLVWIADALKGLAPVLVARYALHLPEVWVAVVALAALLGHCFSVYLRLTGGRGVSTSLGIALGLDWRVGVICFACWIVIVAATRFISLGSLIGVSLAPPLLYLLGAPPAYVLGTLAVDLVVIIRHAPNIRRLLNGTERKIGQKEKPAVASEDAL